jgi:hypothetical protein
MNAAGRVRIVSFSIIVACLALSASVAAQSIDELIRRAEKGDAHVQCKLGEMYGTGSGGVLKDTAEEARWYRMAAEQGDPNGQNALGGMYRRGEGVPQDYAEAARWLRKAAEQGNVYGQGWLASMYEDGNGVKQDRPQALYWYDKAAQQGDSWARDQAQRLRASMVKLPGANDAESSVAESQPHIERRLALDEIEDLLAGGVSPKRTDALVQQYGVNFELTERIKVRLLKLGADEALLLAIVKNHR